MKAKIKESTAISNTIRFEVLFDGKHTRYIYMTTDITEENIQKELDDERLRLDRFLSREKLASDFVNEEFDV